MSAKPHCAKLSSVINFIKSLETCILFYTLENPVLSTPFARRLPHWGSQKICQEIVRCGLAWDVFIRRGKAATHFLFLYLQQRGRPAPIVSCVRRFFMPMNRLIGSRTGLSYGMSWPRYWGEHQTRDLENSMRVLLMTLLAPIILLLRGGSDGDTVSAAALTFSQGHSCEAKRASCCGSLHFQ